MGIKERKEREKKRRRDQILTAAIELIEEQGFEKTTMDEIAERAELSKGTLYLYFNDKSTLHQAVKKRGLEHLYDKFLQVIKQDLPGAELVKKMMLTFLNTLTHNAAFTKAMVLYEHIKEGYNKEKQEEPSIVEDCKNIEDELFMIMVRAIQIGIQDGSIKTHLEPKVLALMLSFQMSGMLKFYLSGSHDHAQKILNDNELSIPKLLEEFLEIQFHEKNSPSDNQE
ncbi:TetR/AcrR family transcriptional regulator [Gracilimonas tropica]|uniref:TetR/AcrR family transcriptional regulator n=1 Tax=Gracilimonas tropica TaxID=454600 RepID=UPI0003620828|nr:TetR/AcrR family transcriptional regulator [Gracilimonas tropica]